MERKSMPIFRTFPTVKKDRNVAIHAFLTALEERYKENKNEFFGIIAFFGIITPTSYCC